VGVKAHMDPCFTLISGFLIIKGDHYCRLVFLTVCSPTIENEYAIDLSEYQVDFKLN
jgi:hypothetical protein